MNLALAYSLTRNLMDAHGLQGWGFKWDNARRRHGACDFRNKRIQLSRAATELMPEDTVRNTILHEIAHALVGPGHGHGWLWRAKAIAIGCNGSRLVDAPMQVPGKWVGRCPNGHVRYKYRRPRGPISCGVCSPHRWNPAVQLTFTKEQ